MTFTKPSPLSLKGYGDMKISLLFSEPVWYSEMYGFSRFPES
jgi:hypothetical protein